MTSFDRIERNLPELMADLTAARVPDYFDDILQETARTRQRPAWSSLERWLPMDVALSPLSNRVRPLAGLLVLALVGLLVAASLAVYVGSNLHRLPAPFGPAGNGLMYYANAAGEIVSVDPAIGTPTTVLKGPDRYEYPPNPSRDGQSILFDHTVGPTSQIFVAGADGANVHPLAGT